jgi:putative endonuclease
MGFWVYILRCRDGAYYTGHTEDVEARVAQHQCGAIKGFTSSRLPVTLVWCGELPTREEAIASERRIKGWSRAKKEALIAGDWERLSILARNRQDDGRPSTSSGRTAVVNPGAS